MFPTGPKAPALTVVFHPDTSRIGDRAVLWDAGLEGGEALLSRRELAFRRPRGGPALPLDDPYLSRRPIRFAGARYGGIRIDCTRTGTRVVANGDWISDERVFLGVEVDRGVVLVLSERISVLLHNLVATDVGDLPSFGLVGDSSPMEHLRREIRECVALGGVARDGVARDGVARDGVARAGVARDGVARDGAGDALPVLLVGEPGTGKKTVARAIHDAGGRNRPFVTLIGADDGPARTTVPDLLAQAAGGALVLDAVDRMESELQCELLRALERGRDDLRILATCSHLVPRSSTGAPLIEKLDWNRLDVPALESRRDDVARLVFHFLREELAARDALHRLDPPGPYDVPWFPVRLVAELAAYEWPDNVRQLRHVVRRLVREHHARERIDGRIDLDELLDDDSVSSTVGWDGWTVDSSRNAAATAGRAREISEIEILAALRAHRWQAEPTAASLGITPEVLFAMMERFFDQGERRTPSRRNPSLP